MEEILSKKLPEGEHETMWDIKEYQKGKKFRQGRRLPPISLLSYILVGALYLADWFVRIRN